MKDRLFYNLHVNDAGGAEDPNFEHGSGSDEGLGDGVVALGKEVLELVDLEEVGDSLAAAVLAAGALPTLELHLAKVRPFALWMR